jgi:GINS complex subunit 3
MTSSSYYDIEAILAEEELVPCTTLFEFSHLAHLDPDARTQQAYLNESSRIKIPLWAVEKWAMLGFVRLSLPRHYGRKARERLEADPGDADLRYVFFCSAFLCWWTLLEAIFSDVLISYFAERKMNATF